MKIKNIYGYFIGIAVYLRLMFKIKELPRENFNDFIRYNLHKIYEEDKWLDVEKIILLICMYVAFYVVYTKLLSLHINDFKKMIRYKSKRVFELKRKTIIFFLKFLISNTVVMISAVVSIYIFITKNYEFSDYIFGIADLLKLPLLLLIVLLISVSYNFNKIMIFSMCYFSIIIYIFFVNYLFFKLICFVDILFLLFVVLKVVVSKEEV
ncbi:hypothetical protein [Gemella cuniculi]|uniref:hypothetical protein n=1 Tax=Gemella cuniculi TaxID=150240 RepID=UPI000425F25A|nr:hypothetical protein [Gemella cuniculi]